MTLLPADFRIVVGMEGRAIEVAVHGHLDAPSGLRVADLLLDILAAGHRQVVVELAGATSADAEGLRAVEQALKRCRSRGARVTLRGPGRS